MYRIYASKAHGDVRLETLVPYEYQERDKTAQRCIELFRKGYAVHKVVLPRGTEILRHDIEHAIKIGTNSMNVALSE